MTEPMDVAIAEAMYAWLKTPALTSPATPIVAPFVKYVPISGTAYLDVRPLLTAKPQHFNLDFGGSDILNGIFQVDAAVPDGAGQNPGLRLADAVATRFAIGTTLIIVSAIGARKLRVMNQPDTAAAVKDASWIRFPVSIPYQLIT